MRPGFSRAPDASGLVEILLEEGQDDAAWQSATEWGCRVDLWFALAARRAGSYPEDAVRVYTGEIESALADSSPRATREAAELLLRGRALLLPLGHASQFDRLCDVLRSKHRQRRSFWRLLAAAGV